MSDPLSGSGPHPLQSPRALSSLSERLSQLKTRNHEDDVLSDLGSDYSDGPSRLVADPDSPTSRLLERAARRSLAASARNTPEKFSFMKDIARNPEIARAARRALSTSPGGADHSGAAVGNGGSMQPLQSTPELDSLTAVIDQLDRDAAQESRINQQMASVTLGRLQSGRLAAERTLGVLQAFAAAEAAYSRAMSSVAKLSLCGEADGPSLRAALEQFSDLPMLMGASHTSVVERLADAIRGLQGLVNDLRAACEEVGHGATRAKREVDGSRQALKAALKSHQDACQTFQLVSAQRQRQGGRGKGVESDPWLTEGCLVEQQVRLQRAQHVERQYLAKAFQRVGELERRRTAAVQQTLGTFLQVYRAAVVPIQQIAGELEELLQGIDAEADLEAFTETAASSVHSAEALSARQREAVDQICSELLGSAEIVRQGSIERWDSTVSKWAKCHLVLTQAGFLHCFAPDSAAAKAAAGSSNGSNGSGGRGGGGGSANGSTGSLRGSPSAVQLSWGGANSWTPPVETLNLSRCSFEQGEAPVFRIIEASAGGLASFALFSGRQRTLTLKAGGIEECMDWAISVREAIASCSG